MSEIITLDLFVNKADLNSLKQSRDLIYYVHHSYPQRSFFTKPFLSPYFLLHKVFCNQVDADNVIPLPQLVLLGNAVKSYTVHEDNNQP